MKQLTNEWYLVTGSEAKILFLLDPVQRCLIMSCEHRGRWWVGSKAQLNDNRGTNHTEGRVLTHWIQ